VITTTSARVADASCDMPLTAKFSFMCNGWAQRATAILSGGPAASDG
jgi:hypothetical protein